MRLLGNKIAGTLSLEWAMHFERLQTEETNGREIAEPIDDERGDLTTPESFNRGDFRCCESRRMTIRGF
jgi:hypothetical protein